MDPSRLQFILFEALTFIGVAAFLVFWWFGKLPTIETFTKLVDTLNTRGGNILILLVLSAFGMFASVRMLYYLVQLSVDGRLQQDNSFALLSISFLTNTITGAFIGALLKTMSGDTEIKHPEVGQAKAGQSKTSGEP